MVLAEPWVPRGERPDVIGWNRDGAGSIVIEAKVARRDFQKEWSATDRDRKSFRRGNQGAGVRRYYMAPVGVIPLDALEETGWGLIVPRGRILTVVRESKCFVVNYKTELAILVRAASDPKYGKQRPFQIQLPF